MESTTLYKKDTKGKTRVWTVELDGDKYRTITGELGGKLVTNEWTVAKPMNVGKANETSGARQAAREVQADIKKKKEKNYVESVDDIDEQSYESPMLAKSFDDYGEDVVYPVASQPKLDGIRANINDVQIMSRNGKEITSCPHLIEALKAAYRKIRKEHPELGDFEFDGELYNHELKANFNRICSLVKRTKPDVEDLVASKKLIEFWCYDIKTDKKVSFEQRSLIIEKYLGGIESVVVVETAICNTRQQLDDCYELYMERGYEGQIIRVLASLYQFKRTKDLLKRKEFQDGEWLIDRVFEGEGNRTGTAGYVTLLDVLTSKPFLAKGGEQVKSNIKGPFEFLEKMWLEREELHGKKVTIKYFNLTPDGVPRFPYVIAIRDYE